MIINNNSSQKNQEIKVISNLKNGEGLQFSDVLTKEQIECATRRLYTGGESPHKKAGPAAS